MSPFDSLLEVGKEFGLYGVIAVVVILVLVFIGRKAGLIATGDHARIANVVLSAILFGLSGDPGADTALMTAIGSIASALLYELLKWIGGKFPARGSSKLPSGGSAR